MDWQEEPATQQQLFRLHEYGFAPACPLTVTQAARLIRQYSRHAVSSTAPPPAAQVSGWVVQPLAREEPGSVLKPRGGAISESARMHAHHLRLAVGAAERAMTENPDRPNVRADFRSSIAARQQFWLDTCRDDKEMHAASLQALEFYQHLGARFFTPTWEEVREVLDALDGAMPGWDKDHPELFYETLRLNFPSLLRQK